jgi:hypothetical protein
MMSHAEFAEKSASNSRTEPAIALSIMVPCFNEAENLKGLHHELTGVCGPIVNNYEIVLVNDGSGDRSWPVDRCFRARPAAQALGSQAFGTRPCYEALGSRYLDL